MARTAARASGARAVVSSQCYYADIDLLDERDTHLLAAPVSHGAGLYALPYLLKGAPQIVPPHFDVPAVLDALQRYRQGSMFAAPTRLTRLVHAPEVSGKDRDQRLLGRLEFAPFAVRTGLAAGGNRIRTIGPSCMTSTRIGLKKHRSFVRKVSRDACARVKCSGGAAILTIEWLDRDHRHVRTLYRNPRLGHQDSPPRQSPWGRRGW